MVRSRSEINLNRIFLDLCTSPQLRNKHDDEKNNQRQYHPPLPTLKPIRSNSCSNLNDLSENFIESSSSFDNDQIEQKDTTNLINFQPIPLMEKLSIKHSKSTAVPLVPVESTGFTIQKTLQPTHPSLTLFEPISINHKKKPLSQQESPKENKKNNFSLLPINSSTTSQDWKQQDFTNRLQNRLKSRGHLRKFFLS